MPVILRDWDEWLSAASRRGDETPTSSADRTRKPQKGGSVTTMITNEQLFKMGQMPAHWCRSAKRLRDAAESIFESEQPHELPYLRAHAEAERKARALACVADNRIGEAEIEYVPPNYVPGQLLYAYALENVFKGLMVANKPELASEIELSSEIKSHNLVELAKRAAFDLTKDEQTLLRALTEIGEWAGRYPVAANLDKHSQRPLVNSHHLLDYGSQHVSLRRVFQRGLDELESKLESPSPVFGAIVVFGALTS